MYKMNKILIEGTASNFHRIAKSLAVFTLSYTQPIYERNEERTELHSFECIARYGEDGTTLNTLDYLFSEKEQPEVKIVGHLEQTYANKKACCIVCEFIGEAQ